ncbi:MAG: MmcQ/YjbR family DNA-binding protein [Candidatus Kapabacteria bacterium]|jgi:predicted DNA-binding protein (MmcQ/YjbR family)|nr:MmcQ/YjbR family DNA-binding protein [Candidatus Kapabacteria bacterium]
MILEQIRNYCLSLPFVSEDMKWGDNLCFSVAEKLFLVVSLDEPLLPASFKVSDEDFIELCLKPEFVQAPYFAKNKWVKVNEIEKFQFYEWKIFIDNAYKLISLKLTKKLQAEIHNQLSQIQSK